MEDLCGNVLDLEDHLTGLMGRLLKRTQLLVMSCSLRTKEYSLSPVKS